MPARAETADAWFDDLAEGVVLFREGRVARLNRAAATLLGVAPEAAVGLPAIAVLRDHRLERAWQAGTPVQVRVRGRRVQAVPIRSGLALRDVEEALRAQEHARELLAVLSHELRTPLTTVRSTLDALAYDDLPARTREGLLERAVGEADRLVRLLDDLTRDVAPPRARSVPLREAAGRALGVLEPVLKEHAVRVRVDLPPATVWVDADKLMQVFLNLVENAAIHGPPRSEVLLTAREERGWVHVVVRDRGRPLDPEDAEALFAPGVRGPDASGRGTGLGLYVVRGIAERWGGRAWARPWREEAGPESIEGNEFGVLVPLDRSVAASAAAPAAR